MTTELTPTELVAQLLRLLDVDQQGPDLFQGQRKPGGVGRVFGGQVIGQALASAERTVADDRGAHSLHAYFLRGGSEDYPVDFRVERDFDGGSFSNRRVIASQQGTPILNLTASFHRREPGLHHASSMPDVHGPDGLEDDATLRSKNADLAPEVARAWLMRPRPIEIRPVDPAMWHGYKRIAPIAHLWIRAKAPLPDDPRIHRAVLAYASDMCLLNTCLLPHGVRWSGAGLKGASLDHALWFHDDFRADEWLLYACDSPWAGNARGFNRGMLFTQDGRLVAEVAQEGMVRIVQQT
jgi:acyl-CoA thioesterase-2